MSGFVVLPFPGAWVDQPTWIREDLFMLLQVKHWHELNETLPNIEGVPSLEDAI